MVVPPQDSIGENAVMPSRTESSTQNGQLASRSVQDVDTDGVRNSQHNGEMSRLDQLLEQVKTLKQENSSLKSELSNNTSQINRLESEASSLKEMVMLLGNTIGSQRRPVLDHGDVAFDGRRHSYQTNNLMLPLNFVSYPYSLGLPATYPSSSFSDNHFLCGGGFNADAALPASSPISHNANIYGRTKEHIRSLQMRRSAILDSLKKEEIAKECYMRRLNDLNERLKILDTDQPFPDGDKTRHQLESSIRDVKDAMEQELGSHDMMKQRDWLLQIKVLDQECVKLRAQLSQLESPLRPTMEGCLPGNTYGSVEDRGSCERHEITNVNNKRVVEVSVQTPRHPGTLEALPDDKVVVSRSSMPDARNNTVLHCVAVQSKLTCLVRVSQAARAHQRTPSVTSLPDHLGVRVGLGEDPSTRLKLLRSHLAPSVELVQQHCRLLRRCLDQQGKLDERGPASSSAAAASAAAQSSLGSKAQVSEALLRTVHEIRQLSHTEAHRGIINQLQGTNCLADLLVLDRRATRDAQLYLAGDSEALVQHTGFALTNLCLGNNNSKAMLIKKDGFLETVFDHLRNRSEAIAQAMACILRNLSWQADAESRDLLRTCGAVRVLMECVTAVKREGALITMLGALWNLSSHGTENQAEICAHDGFLPFLISVLPIRNETKTEIEVVSYGGGVLRNVSTIIANNNEYRKILRKHKCLQCLVQHLSSPSLTVVSNACSTLGNLSARDTIDQSILWELGAVDKLRKLIHSKHREIAQGSVAAIRNLAAAWPEKIASLFPGAADGKKPDVPSLQARKMKQFELEVMGGARLQGRPAEGPQAPGPDLEHGRGQVAQLQKHSRQEIAAENFDPDTSGLLYSASLGNLAYRDSSAMSARKPFATWDANAMPPTHFIAVPDPARDPRFVRDHHHFATNDPARAIFRPNALHLTSSFHTAANCARLGSDASYSPIGPKPERTWGQQNRVGQTAPVRPAWTALDSGPKGLSPIRMPDDLEEKLRYADLQEEDDRPVNYSLQYTDELSRTPGVQSPRADIFQRGPAPLGGSQLRRSTSLRKVSLTPETSSGLTQTRLPTSVSAPSIPRFAYGESRAPKVDRSVEERMRKMDPELCGADDAPTDFGSMYTEMRHESVSVEPPFYQHLVGESYKQNMYLLSPGVAAPAQRQESAKDCDEKGRSSSSYSAMKSRKGPGDDESTGQADGPSSRTQAEDYENNEEEDKFETGEITPGHYYMASRHGTRSSGIMTPKTPYYQDTPLMYCGSPAGSLSSDEDMPEITSERDSLPETRPDTGVPSPSELPDSPGQSMPPSRSRSPAKQQITAGERPLYHDASAGRVARERQLKTSDAARGGAVQLTASAAIGADRSAAPGTSRSAGYVSSLPQSDEIKCFSVEPAMSEMTGLSGITMDDGVQVAAPLGPGSELSSVGDRNLKKASDGASCLAASPGTAAVDQDPKKKPESRAINDVGYVRSLPTSDEIKHYVTEGSFSPMTMLSEISALRDHNEGFQSGPKELVRQTGSNRNSIASRSSATGTSTPLPPVSSGNKTCDRNNAAPLPKPNPGSAQETKPDDILPHALPTTAESASPGDVDDDLDSSDSLSDDSEDEALLWEAIAAGQPKRQTRSRSSKPSSSSNRGKDRAGMPPRKTAPEPPAKASPEPTTTPPDKTAGSNTRRFDIEKSIAAAETKLEGIHIVDYIDRKMSTGGGDATSSEREHPSSKSHADPAPCENGDRTHALSARQVINTVETLNESYSVKKQLRVNERRSQPASRPPDPEGAQSGQAKVRAFLQNGPVSYNVENTPIEMSRATSLSNLTVDSGPDTYDFSALHRRIAEKQVAENAEKNPLASDSSSRVPQSRCDGPETVPGHQLASDGSQLAERARQTNAEPDAAASAGDRAAENLTREFENVTASSQGRLTNCVGYVTSLPVGDEIKRYNAEGSVSAFTNFSALTVDSGTKIKPCVPDVQQSGALAAPPTARPQSLNAREPSDMPDVQSRHYGVDSGDAAVDASRRFVIEDTPLVMSGNSSLSSIDIESDDENKLLDMCISSAMPVTRVDPTAPLPPKQLLLLQPALPSFPRPNAIVPTTGSAPVSDPLCARGAAAGTDQHLSAISPLSLVSLSSPDQPSTSFSVSTASKARTGDSYYHLSRQPSICDSLSDTSLGAGDDAHALMKSQKKSQKASSRSKAGQGKASARDLSDEPAGSAARRDKKARNRSPVRGKSRENRKFVSRCKDAAACSSSSSGTRRPDAGRRGTSSSSKSPCNKHHPPRSTRAMPISASTSKLTDSPGRALARGAGSSCSRPACREYGHAVRKPGRSRSAHSACYSPYGTQLYPPMKNNEMLSGVACMAARGDLVVMQQDANAPGLTPQIIPVTIPYEVARPMLAKQNTFVKESPSEELLQSKAGKKPKKSASAPTKLSKKASDQNIGKHVLKGLKKLLSPSEDPKHSALSPAKANKGQSATNAGQTSGKASAKTERGFDSSTWTKNKGKKKAKETAAAKSTGPRAGDPTAKHSNLSLSGSSKTSSLSLSSSNSDASSGDAVDAFKASGPVRTIYPTERSIKAAQHVPKSPSLRSSMAANRSPKGAGSSSGSWRRTPASDRVAGPGTRRKISVESSSSASTRYTTPRPASGAKQGPGPQNGLPSATKANKGRKTAAGQTPEARSVSEETESSSRTNPVEPSSSSHFFAAPVRRVVQEVAPFNYRPYPKPSETSRTGDDSSSKSDISRRHTAL